MLAGHDLATTAIGKQRRHLLQFAGMANFHTHVTFSSVIGCGYAATGLAMGVSLETAILGGGLCGISGMLPDLDSDTGIPLRESMAFAAAIVPALLLERIRAFNLSHDEMVLMAAGLYFFVRFGVTKLIAGRTSHRGMFHSIPAALIFAGTAFLVCGGANINIRYFKAGGVFLGVMSHLVLDEIYSFEVKRGKMRIKRSFGTAMKFWSKNTYSNFSTYAKLAIITIMILSEPAVMQRLDGRSPTIASTIRQWQDQLSVWKSETVAPLVEFQKNEQIGHFSTSPKMFAGSNRDPGNPTAPGQMPEQIVVDQAGQQSALYPQRQQYPPPYQQQYPAQQYQTQTYQAQPQYLRSAPPALSRYGNQNGQFQPGENFFEAQQNFPADQRR